jgi:predicted pyridoxine 5'-phosphate oxidase superfamily flavin-nucleotide-binding protein
MDSPFHSGEQHIQTRLGVRDKLEEIGRRVIRDHMPEQHREFFALLPWLLVGSRDAAGQPHASVLWGQPGFVHSPQPRRLQIQALPEGDDPLAANLHEGTGLGLLGIELPTRRRNRLNGRASNLDGGGFAVDVHESFGNCPKYIQVRRWQAEPREPGLLEQGEGLDPRWLPLALNSDTLFIASSHGEDVDVSHRGGPPGFVSLGVDGRLWLPDYSGNFMFNTLGNLLLEPRCALLWIDFASGDLLHLEAHAELLWPEDYKHPAPPGAERMLALTPGRWRLRRARLPLAFGTAEPSPFLPVQGH